MGQAAKKTETLRYGDETLETFRGLIEDKIKKTEEEITLMKSFVTNENGTNDTSSKIISIDNLPASNSLNDSLIYRKEQYLCDLKLARARTLDKSYGICSVTKNLIPEERLKANLITQKTIAAKNLQKV